MLAILHLLTKLAKLSTTQLIVSLFKLNGETYTVYMSVYKHHSIET